MGRRGADRTVKRGARKRDEPRSDRTTTPAQDSTLVREAQEGSTSISEPDSDREPDSVAEPELVTAPTELGRYQLLFELARGGMGTVHVGRLRGAHGFDRLVAIKRLKADGATPDDVAAFLSEARVTARIKHSNVVQTLDVGEHNGLPFLVMDLVEGVSLARLQRRARKAGERLDPFLTVWMMIRVAEGLHAAHELTGVDGQPSGLVHRDVSPENVLLSFDGGVYVVDFGVAKFAAAERHETQSGVVKGKFAYMSPEQTEAKELDRRSDVFALGIVMHECLLGRRLFAGRSVADTIRRIWQVEPASPTSVRDDVPPALEPLVMRCLAKDRQDRTASCATIADGLRKILRAEGRTIDESDVASLVARFFPAARDDLRGRIRDAVKRADETGASGAQRVPLDDLTVPDDEPVPSEAGSVTASVTAKPAGVPTSSSWGAGAAVALVLLMGLGVWAMTRPADSRPADPREAAPTPTAVESGGPSSNPTTTQATTASGAPIATADPSAATSASASVATPAPRSTAPRSTPPTIAPRPPPVVPKTPPAPPLPTSTSHKGVPFQTLDP
jgi:eukaryotic-like serine/threonine-protein kinase